VWSDHFLVGHRVHHGSNLKVLGQINQQRLSARGRRGIEPMKLKTITSPLNIIYNILARWDEVMPHADSQRLRRHYCKQGNSVCAIRGFCVTFCTAPRRAAHSEFYNWSDLFWEQESGEKEIRFFHFKSSVFLFV